MKRLDRIFYVLVLAAVGFAVAGLCLAYVNDRTNDTLFDIARYDVAIECGQTQEQLSRFGQDLGFYLASPTTDAHDSLQTALQIFEGRANAFDSGSLRGYAHSSLARRDLVNRYRQSAAKLQAAAQEALAGTGGSPLAAVDASHYLLAKMCTDTQVYSSDAIEATRSWLQWNNQVSLLLTIGLVTSGLGLIILLGLQNVLARNGYKLQTQTAAMYERLAKHDPLTALPNRNEFMRWLLEAFARIPDGNEVAVITLDLDRFKLVNDSMGHGAGDRLLLSVAHRLQTITGQEKDVHLARLGGDEFVVVVETASGNASRVSGLAERIVDALRTPHEIDGQLVPVWATLGIALAPDHTSEATELARMSDTALYCAKSKERGTWRVYEPAMDQGLRMRRALEMDLARAIDRNQLSFHYQPIVDLESFNIRGVEALMRWTHPTHGPISPATFIPIAEEAGLIVHIGEVMLRRACLDALRMPSDWQVAVNLSAAQFLSGDLVEIVRSALGDVGLPPHRLELEITESVVLKDDSKTLRILQALKNMGVGIALDDFGTGYSSLSYLRKFGFDKLKIDRSFIQDIPHDTQSVQIVRSIASLAQSLGMIVTVEGIEKPEQCPTLMFAGCTHAQGYFFARPAPLPQLLQRLQREPKLVRTAMAS